MTQNIIIDIARYQHPFDFSAFVASDAEVLVHRATIGSLYVDPFYISSVAEMIDYGITQMDYHVVRMDYTAKAQMENYISTRKKASESTKHNPTVLDLELDNGKSSAEIAQIIYDCAHIIEDEYGIPPVMYSRKNWIETYIGSKYWLNDYYWWIAYYPWLWQSYTGTPALPKMVSADKLLMHQVTSNASGAKYGANSKSIDLSTWKSSVSLRDFFAKYSGESIETPVNVLHIAEYDGEYHVSVNDLADGMTDVICLPQDTDGYRMVQLWRDELE